MDPRFRPFQARDDKATSPSTGCNKAADAADISMTEAAKDIQQGMQPSGSGGTGPPKEVPRRA